MRRALVVWGALVAGAARADTWALVDALKAEAVAPLDLAWRAAWGDLVEDLGRHAPSGRLPADAQERAAALGLRLDVGPDRLLLVDAGAPTRGLPALLLWRGPLPAELVVQAPHPYADLHTGRLAAELFDLGRARAALIHTTRRDAGPGADPAHSADGAFQGATDALARALRDPLFVQVHGFGEGTSDADAVVSTGRAFGLDAAAAAARLGAALGRQDLRGADEVPALAARSNAQGLLLAGRARFLHVELSLPLRQELRARPEQRVALADALLLLAAREPLP